MQFSVNVLTKIGDRYRQFSWKDGELVGDAEAIAMIREVAALRDGTPVGLKPSAFTVVNHLSNPYSALWLCNETFLDVRIMQGLPPLPDDTPPDAVN